MDPNNLEEKIDELKMSVDVLALIEFCKHGAKKDDVREIFGSLDNNLFSKVNKIINPRGKK